MNSISNELKPKWNLSWIFLLSLPILVWALWPYPSTIKKSPFTTYIFKFEVIKALWFFACFYGLYVLPGLVIFFRVTRHAVYNSFFTPNRLLLAFGWGMVAHVLAIFIQKYLHLPFKPWVVLGCLLIAYAVLAFFFRPLKFLLQEEAPGRKWDFITWPVLILTLVLGGEMILRARTSSVSLMGDAFIHMILLVGTMMDGPLPNGMPFYSTFILNLHPLSFHALLANLFTLIPGIEHIDLFRYFSLVMLPCFVFVFFSFFSMLSGSRPVAAMGTLALLAVSGGGLSSRVPIVYFPWYWGLAWYLTAVIFYLILKGELKSRPLYFWAGVILGVGVLMHPMMAPRMGAILCCFFPLELLRRALKRETLLPVLTCGALFILGAGGVLVIWLGPMVLQFGLEEAYSYEYIIQNFSKIVPDAVKYLRYLHETRYGLKDLFPWILENGGIFPLVLSPLGLIAAVLGFKKPAAPLLLAWVIAMASAVLLGYLPNSYRYFEYLFLGMVSLAIFGMGWITRMISERWQPLLLWIFLGVGLVGVRVDFWPKYRVALQYYGRTQWPDNIYENSRRIVRGYQDSRQKGQLDRDFGGFRGFLWARHKKVWDIYIKRPKKK